MIGLALTRGVLPRRGRAPAGPFIRQRALRPAPVPAPAAGD
jgi:hypothetical protein